MSLIQIGSQPDFYQPAESSIQPIGTSIIITSSEDDPCKKFSEIIEKTANFTIGSGKERALYWVNSDVTEIEVTLPTTISARSVYTLTQAGTQIFKFVAGIGATVLGNAESWGQYTTLNAVKVNSTNWLIIGG